MPPVTAHRPTRTLLERDALGSVVRLEPPGETHSAWLVERDTRTAWRGLRLLARRLAAREARALEALAHVPQVPRLAAWDGRCLRRSWLEGAPMQLGQPPDRLYFREALRLVRRLHAAGIVHNDLRQTPNWLVTLHGRPALVGFRLAMRPRYRGRRFRALAAEDLRQLLEHKRDCCADAMTARQRAFLAPRSWLMKVWTRTLRPLDVAVGRLALH
ncbi:MAG TPA: hypothetical protein VFP48_07970, partial [Steroidobacteraceae bacterium]|nr:hypothetical protein [Steroidobacteraceae bacterium]